MQKSSWVANKPVIIVTDVTESLVNSKHCYVIWHLTFGAKVNTELTIRFLTKHDDKEISTEKSLKKITDESSEQRTHKQKN